MMIHTWVSCHFSHYIQMPGKNKQKKNIYIDYTVYNYVTTNFYISLISYAVIDFHILGYLLFQCGKHETSTMFQPSSLPVTFHPSFFRNWTRCTKHGNSHDRLGDDFLTNNFVLRKIWKENQQTSNINRCFFSFAVVYLSYY